VLPFDDPFHIRELGEIVRHQRSQRLCMLLGLSALAATSGSAQPASKSAVSYEPAAVTPLGRTAREGASSDTLLTPDALQGPPTPAAMFAIAELDHHQLTRYLAAYRDHMVATWDTRSGVASALGMLNKAVERGDEDAARYYGTVAGRLWTRVAEQDRGFDQVVETILRKGQRKQYREWKEKLARGAAEQGRLESAP
jgi:hypothetical protein